MNRLTPAVALLTVLLSACSGGSENPPPPTGEPVAVPKLAPETVVVDAATNAALSTYSFDNAASCLPGAAKLPLDAASGKLPDVRSQPFVPCQGRLTFSSTTPLLAGLGTGSILVSGPVGGRAPYGYLQRVKSVSSAGGVTTVLTEQASLDEALIEGEFDQNARLKPANLASLSLAPGVTLPGKLGAQGVHQAVTLGGPDLAALGLENFAFDIDTVLFDADDNPSSTHDQIRLKGNFNLAADNGIDLGLKWKKILGVPIYPKGVTFRAAYGFSQQASVRVEADLQTSVDKEVELAQYTFSPITFFVGPVPVVLVPSVKITADLRGNVKANLTFGASENLTARAGFEYNDGFKNIGEFSRDFSKYADAPALAGSAEAGVNLKGDILLYGLVGPYARVRASATFDGQIPRDPVWRLSAAAQLYAGIHADLLVKTLNYDAKVYDLPPFEFAQSEPQPPTLSITTPPNGTKVQRGGGLFAGLLCVSGEDPQQGRLPAQVTAGGAPIGTTSGVNNCLQNLPASVFSKVGPVKFTATVTNKYGQSAAASSGVTVENVPPSTYIVKPEADAKLFDKGKVYLQGYVVSGSDKIECPLPPGTSLTFTSDNPADVMPDADTFCTNPVATFNGVGTRKLTLTATDTTGAPGSLSRDLLVGPAPTNYAPDIALLEPVITDGTPTVNWGAVIPLKARLSDQDTSTLTYTWKYRPEKGQALKTFGGGTALGASAITGTTVTGSFDTGLVNPPGCGSGTPFSIALEASDGVNPPVLREFEFKILEKIC